MKTRIKTMLVILVSISMIIFLTMPVPVLAAEPTVNLGTTASFAVLAGSEITNTGPTTIIGDIGVSPGSSITGFPPGTVSDGTIYTDDEIPSQAQLDLTIAYDDAASREVTSDLTGQDLGGMTLTTGVYSFSSSAQLTGTLTLDAEGDPDAVFIFQIDSTLTTAPSSVVRLINGATFCRVFWQVGSSATLDTDSVFVGHIFALTSIAANSGASVQGQLLARNGAVTLINNSIINGECEDEEDDTTTETTADDTATETTADDTATETTADDTATETTADDTTTETTAADTAAETTADYEEVPRTGEAGNFIMIGIILSSLALSLAILNQRRKTD